MSGHVSSRNDTDHVRLNLFKRCLNTVISNAKDTFIIGKIWSDIYGDNSNIINSNNLAKSQFDSSVKYT